MSRRGPTDTQRLWVELVRAGRLGIHSFDIRVQLGMGNPSQRVSEIESDHDCRVPRRREKRNGRMGVRYFHPDHGPAGLGDGLAVAVAEPSGNPTPVGTGGDVADSLSSLGAETPAADPDRKPEKTEQLGLIATAPSMYDTAA